MTEQQLSDPVLGPPSARSPWSATLCWSPEQNFGRVSLLTGRTSLGTVWGRLEAGESPEEVAKDFGLQVSAVHVVDQLRRDVAEQLVESGLQDAVEALASTVNGSPRTARTVVVQYPGLAHVIDRVTRFAVPPVDVYAVPDVLPDHGPSGAPVEVAVSSPADLVRAEHVSGVEVADRGPSTPLVSPVGRDDERGLRAEVSSLDIEPTVGDLGIADGPGDEYRSGPGVTVDSESRVADEPQYALIEVRGPEGVEYPVVERNKNGPAGWRSGAYLYLDADVLSVRPLVAYPVDECRACPKDAGRDVDGFVVCEECGWTDRPSALPALRDRLDAARQRGDELAAAALPVASRLPDGPERFRVQRAVRAWEEAR